MRQVIATIITGTAVSFVGCSYSREAGFELKKPSFRQGFGSRNTALDQNRDDFYREAGPPPGYDPSNDGRSLELSTSEQD
jgi:hypothetical protein